MKFKKGEAEMFSNDFIQIEQEIKNLLSISPNKTVEKILKQTKFSTADTAVLVKATKKEWPQIIKEAERRRQKRWQGKLFLVPPLYVTNHCSDDCVYCSYRRSNHFVRRRLTEKELLDNISFLIEQGYRVIELVGATDHYFNPQKTAKLIGFVKEELSKSGGGWVGLNFFPFSKVGDYEIVSKVGLDFMVCWQETYDTKTYEDLHPKGPKANILFRLDAFDRAIQGGVKNVGLAFLGGLYNWHYELLMTIAHGQYLEKTYGVPPFILGMPRYKGTGNDELNGVQLSPFTDEDYLFVAAIYKLVFPNSLPWFSTREKFGLSVQAAQGGGALFTLDCSTAVGGYLGESQSQFPVYSKNVEQGIEWLRKQSLSPLHSVPIERK